MDTCIACRSPTTSLCNVDDGCVWMNTQSWTILELGQTVEPQHVACQRFHVFENVETHRTDAVAAGTRVADWSSGVRIVLKLALQKDKSNERVAGTNRNDSESDFHFFRPALLMSMHRFW